MGLELSDFLELITVSIDPGGIEGVKDDKNVSETGITVCARGANGHAYVLADLSGHYTPEEWAKMAVERGFDQFKADRITAESNQGGKLVTRNINAYREGVPVKLVRATRGKWNRSLCLRCIHGEWFIMWVILMN
jgi:phage terminase large subunit-like protein